MTLFFVEFKKKGGGGGGGGGGIYFHHNKAMKSYLFSVTEGTILYNPVSLV